MNQRHYLLRGTFLLTGAGLITRIAGFFYKIFLSRTIGAKEIGLFQLTMPVYAFGTAVCIGGIQTAIARFTAEYHAKNDVSAARRILFFSLLLSVSLAGICTAVLFTFAPGIASVFLLEPLCEPLLRIIALSLPFCAIHACISGYYIGCRNVSVSALSQILEQLIRVGSVLLFYMLLRKSGRTMDASAMALGQIAGEAASSMFCAYQLLFGKNGGTHVRLWKKITKSAVLTQYRKILSVSAPLGLNRMLLCVLQGIEAALLPQQLQNFGLSSHDALSVYGTLTGMTLPLLLFPTAVTGAVGTLLLPAVSEARTLDRRKQISATVNTSFQASILLGSFFLTAFWLFGRDAGTLLFHNALSGVFLQRLALLCPFLYLNTTLISVMHGLGMTTAVFLFNIAGFAIRLAGVIFFVPDAGINAYLAGMIFSQIFIAACSLILLHHAHHLTASVTDTFLKAGILCIAGAVSVCLFMAAVSETVPAGWPLLLLSGCFFAAAWLVPAWFLILPQNFRRKFRKDK